MQIIARDNQCVVIGLGVTGMSCARYLARKNIPFSVVDTREVPSNLALFKQEFPEVPLYLGAIEQSVLLNANELIISPGVSLDLPEIAYAIKQGVDYCGDIDLFRREATAPIVAITGSNGKSTVTELVGQMALDAGKRVAVGGNLGTPALDLLSEQEPDLYVLELSSFQLERSQPLNAEVATVLNISADHMDRYANLVAYHQAKHRIFFGCHQAVVNRSDPLSKPLVPETVTQWSFGLTKPDFKGFGLLHEDGIEYLAFEFSPLMAVSELQIIGRHNIENALAALALGHAVNLPMATMLNTLKSFTGLEHRCQFVTSINEVRFYNDSKATNVGATIAALKGLKANVKKMVLIAGGVGKGADFSELKNPVLDCCRAVVLIGEQANALAQMFQTSDIKVVMASSMLEAVELAKQCAHAGDAVLLAPACASFDMFDNYQHRGQMFSDMVRDMQAKGNVA